MGSDRAKLFTRCCYAAVSIVILSVMIWIAWCLFGLTAVPVAEPQRRAIVHYSPTPSPPTEETSASNAISKLPTTSSLAKELAKGDFSPRDKNHSANAERAGDSKPPRIPTAAPKKGPSSVDSGEVLQSRRVSSSAFENRPEEKVDSASGPQHEIAPTRTHLQPETESRVYTSRDEIVPPKRDDIAQSSRRVGDDDPIVDRVPEFVKGETRRRVVSRPGYDDDRGSKGRYGSSADRGRESDERYSKGDTRVYPDDEKFEEDSSRKGDEDDRYRYRGERPRPAEDAVDDGKRVRDEERYKTRNDERYRDRDDDKLRDRDIYRYRDRDDERYRDRDVDRYKGRDDDELKDRDVDRYRDRDDDKLRNRDVDRYRDRDSDKLRDRDVDSYRDRDDDKLRDRDIDRYKDRDDDKLRDRDVDKLRDRDTDRHRDRDDDRYKDRIDDKYRDRDDDRYRDRDTDRYRDRDDDRYRPRYRDGERRPIRDDDDDKYGYRGSDTYRPREDVDEYGEKRYPVREEDRPRSRPRVGDDDSRDEKRGYRPREFPSSSVPASRTSDEIPLGERKPMTSSRYESSLRTDETVTDYDIPVRPYDEDRDRKRSRDDEERRPFELSISPTRARDESYISRPSRSRGYDDDKRTDYISRPRDDDKRTDYISRPRDDDKRTDYISRPRDDDKRTDYISRPREDNKRTDYISRPRDDDKRTDYISRPRDDDRTVIQGSRRSSSERESTRLYTGDRDRSRPVESTRSYSDRKDEVVLDRRSYASDDEYSKGSRREEDDRRRIGDARRRYQDEDDGLPRRRDRIDEDDDYVERERRRDRYDDRYDDRPPPPRPVRRYRDEDDTLPRRDPDRDVKLDGSRYVEKGSSRFVSSIRDEERSYSRDDSYIPSRTYEEDSSESGRRSRRPTVTREPPFVLSTMSPRDPGDSVTREKRYQDREPAVRPLSAKDVIEAANRQSDTSESNARQVFYPVFDPRLSNLTSPEVIQPSERRGTTITLKRRRRNA